MHLGVAYLVYDLILKHLLLFLFLFLKEVKAKEWSGQLIEEEEDLAPFTVQFFFLYLIVALVLWYLYHDTMSFSNLIWP